MCTRGSSTYLSQDWIVAYDDLRPGSIVSDRHVLYIEVRSASQEEHYVVDRVLDDIDYLLCIVCRRKAASHVTGFI